MKTYFINTQKMPLVVEAKTSNKSFFALCSRASTHQTFLQSALLKHGAILFRGFQIADISEFEKFVREFSRKEFFNYAGGVSPRNSLSSSVYTSTEYPPHLKLNLHNELSYSNKYPRYLYFFCQTAPVSGGETTLGDSRRILKNINPKTVGLFKHKKILYKRILTAQHGSGYSWQDAFETEDKNEVENLCRKIEAEFEWIENNCLRISQTQPATVKHPETGEEVWFNQADGFHPSNLDDETREILLRNGEKPRLDCVFGDNSIMCELMLDHIRQVLHQETIPLRWQSGDILILDNLLAAHGRMPFQGERRIVLAMT